MIGLQEAGTVDGGGGGATVELDILDTDSTGVDVRQETVLPRFVAPEQWVLQVLYMVEISLLYLPVLKQ